MLVLKVLGANSKCFTPSLVESNLKYYQLFYSVSDLEVCGNDLCPVIHLRVARPSDSREKDQDALNAIVAYCLDRGVALTTAKYLEKEEHQLPSPRFVVVHALTVPLLRCGTVRGMLL